MNPWRTVAGQPRGVWILFAATLINRAGTMALPYLALYLTQDLGRTPTEAGLTIAVFGVGAIITGPLAGGLADRVGSLRVIQFSLAGSGLLMVGLPWVRDYATIVGLTFLWAVIGEAYRPAGSALVAELVAPEQRKSAFALCRLAANLGMSIGPVVGGILVTQVSYASLFLVDGATSLLAAAVWFVARDSLRGVARPPTDSTDTPMPPPAASVDLPHGGSVFRDRRLVYFMLAFLPVAMVFFQIQGALPLYMVRHLHLSEFSYGAMFLINTTLIIFLEVPLNVWTGRWPYQRSLATGALLIATGFGSLMFAGGALSVAATIVIWTFGEMILMPSGVAYVADIAPEKRRGQYMGAVHMTFSLAFGLGPLCGTFLLERFGGVAVWSAAWIAGGCSALLFWHMASPLVAPLANHNDRGISEIETSELTT